MHNLIECMYKCIEISKSQQFKLKIHASLFEYRGLINKNPDLSKISCMKFIKGF